MRCIPLFSETERAPTQRLNLVQGAFGGSASADSAPSPGLIQLCEGASVAEAAHNGPLPSLIDFLLQLQNLIL